MADRYTYIPLIGIFIVLVWGAAAASRHLKNGMVLAFACGSAVVFVLAVHANVQASHWKNSKAIYTRAIDVIPDNFVAHNNLGVAFVQEKDFVRAESHFKEAVRIYPDYTEATYNLAVLYDLQNRWDESILAYKRILETEKEIRSTIRTESQMKLAIALLKRGDMAEAESTIQKVVSDQPENSAAHNYYGIILFKLGRNTDALVQFEKALSLDPGNRTYAGNLQKIIKGDSSEQK
jgi:Flp pilus assembly protein TadD